MTSLRRNLPPVDPLAELPLPPPNTDGRKEAVKFDKVTARVSKLCYGLDKNYVDPIEITRKVRWQESCRDRHLLTP